ncbi:MAG: NADH:ubiquinone reductase (Na(+)-transporting) subunit A, partial [Polaribacter sp.]
MSKDIRIKKGLHIRLVGGAEKTTTNISLSSVYAVKPEDFHGITLKLIAKDGAIVKAGEALFYAKSDSRILFPSPVSGKIVEVIRGARRKVLAIKIAADTTQEYKDFETKDAAKMSAEEVKNYLFAAGCWPFIKQRPYDVIANPNQVPKAIFVSGYASAPLAADLDYILQGKEAELQAAINAISKLTKGKVHVSVGKNSASPLASLKGIELHKVSGPHPSGNVSTQIAQIDP